MVKVDLPFASIQITMTPAMSQITSILIEMTERNI